METYGLGLLKLIYNTVKNAKATKTTSEIHDSLLSLGVHVDIDLVTAMYRAKSFNGFLAEMFQQDPDQQECENECAEEEAPAEDRKVKDWSKLLADKMDRVIMLLTGDRHAPFMSSELFKQTYVDQD